MKAADLPGLDYANKLGSAHEEVKNIFISIGVNDNYFDKGINKLIANLERVFPNSYLFAIKGSYGWGNVQGVNTQTPRYIEYYKKFKNSRIYVIQKDVGFGDPHNNKWEYKQIGDFIDYIVWKNHMREKEKNKKPCHYVLFTMKS